MTGCVVPAAPPTEEESYDGPLHYASGLNAVTSHLGLSQRVTRTHSATNEKQADGEKGCEGGGEKGKKKREKKKHAQKNRRAEER